MCSLRLPQPPAVTPAAGDLVAELSRIAELDVDAIRQLWRQTFRRTPPAGLSRDMLARVLAYRLQEQHLGGLPASHRKLLDQMAQGGSDDARRLKVGAVLVREHQDVLHEVVVVPAGFHWQGKTYASLSPIAKAVTGTAWNGPRFFGLRGSVTAGPTKANGSGGQAAQQSPAPAGRRGSVRAAGGASV